MKPEKRRRAMKEAWTAQMNKGEERERQKKNKNRDSVPRPATKKVAH